MVAWFAALGVLGCVAIARHPDVLLALIPACGAATAARRARPRAGDLRRRVPRTDRRRGAVRRHGPLRAAARAARVVRDRLARPAAELLRPGRTDAQRGRTGRQSVLRARPGAAAGAAGVARDRRDGHRLAGDDFRRLLRDAPGRAARPAATRHGAPDLGDRARPDLRAGRERASCSSASCCSCSPSAPPRAVLGAMARRWSAR